MEKIRLIFCSKTFSRKKDLEVLDLLVPENLFFIPMEGTVMLKDSVQSMEIIDSIYKDFQGILLILIMEILIKCKIVRSLR